ncbi:alpha/beta hydrolase [Mycolicibacterium sp. F2034L]|uniref:alpha/beta hydrolase n=1 Tax=Mycolicibacterium sp. F2034L TaxID=2926422 RepID=UPI001FF1E61B|nr:alpha/beta hydrolase [Mycolicibacterium sp. F2034L]MCK0176264.1 alpha/beta hydrolase family protein [Mycolicibacterium sp. F2034L]
MQLSDIDSWNVGALQSIAFELGDELKTIEGVAADLDLISRLPGWDSPAADAARGKIGETRGRVLDDAAVIGAVAQLAEETGAAVTKLQTELAAIRADVAAQGGFLHLADNGDVTVSGPPDIREELKPIAESLEARAQALIHQAEDVDADCAEVFGHVQNGDITAREAKDVPSAQEVGRDQSGLSAPYPPEGEGTTPRDVTAWWNALSEEEQRKVIAEHPDWIGNRDGVPVPARSEVNKAALDRELAAAQRDVDAIPTLQEYLRDHGGFGPGSYLKENEYNRMVSERQGRLDNAKAMQQALSNNGDAAKGYDPNKYLMMLEFPEDRQPKAAIAVGNPDTAEHVAVSTPGVGTTPTSLPDMVNEATALRDETGNQLDRAGRGDEEVATIAWLGYEPPQKDISVVEAGFEDRANEAAPDLAEFYRGINATNEHGSDVHLSAFGHSYGSLTTAQALVEVGEVGVVDDAAFYGSPGLGHTNEMDTKIGVHGVPYEVAAPIRDEADMFLPDGHGYVMSAPEDPISGDPNWKGLPLPSAGDIGQFGPNPLTLPLEQLSSNAATSPADNVAREGAETHSDYPRMGSNGDLRTTGYNLAIIAGGLADVPISGGGDRLVR